LLGLLVVPVMLGASCTKRDASPTISPSPSPTDPKVQVEQSYLKHWDVYAAALRNMDTSHLSEVLTGAALTTVTKQVEEQRRMNQPVLIRVEHNYSITLTGASMASVDDNYINHSVRLDPNTGQPIEKDPNQRVHKSYTLKKVNDTWKVSDIIAFK
jgi:hypothetical protein